MKRRIIITAAAIFLAVLIIVIYMYNNHYVLLTRFGRPTRSQISKLTKMAENGDGEAAFRLAGYYIDDGVNLKLGEQWLVIASDYKQPMAMLIHGNRLHGSTNTDERMKGAKIMDEAANLGSDHVKCNVGIDLSDDPLMKDRAIYWLRITTKNDCELGYFILGRLLVENPITREEGMKWLENKNGLASCQAEYSLYKTLYQDKDTHERAIGLFKQSSAHHCPEATAFLQSNKIQ